MRPGVPIPNGENIYMFILEDYQSKNTYKAADYGLRTPDSGIRHALPATGEENQGRALATKENASRADGTGGPGSGRPV